MNNIDFNKYLEIHSPGYVIETYKDGIVREFVIGNKQILPTIQKTTSNTLYDIASLTKMFTAVLVYMAYEEKLLDLYDYVYDLDSNFVNLKSVKVIDLLSHNQNIWTDGYLGNVETKEDFYKVLYSAYVKSDFPTYVDVHYIILATILENIYKISYRDLCINKIFKPLHLENTTFDPDPKNTASNNYEVTASGDVITNITPGVIHDTKARNAKKLGIATGHAAIFTTASDFMKFIIGIFHYNLLKKETVNLMLQHRDCNLDNYNYLKTIVKEDDINVMYDEALKLNSNLNLITINNMGCRYRSVIKKINSIPDMFSDNSITFSGYCGPIFMMDLDKDVIVVVMCNHMHNTHLDRAGRKAMLYKFMDEVLAHLIN